MKGGCGLYIKHTLCYIPRTDLDKRFKEGHVCEFEEWIEIINNKGPSIIIGVNYRHPRNNDNKYLQKTLKKINKEKKFLLMVGDFNYDLIKHDKIKTVSEFLNLMTSNLLQPHILGPTRILDHNKPSINDNIFLNFIDKACHSGNRFAEVSDHLPGFIIIEDLYANITKQPKIFKRDMKKFDATKFNKELESVLDSIGEKEMDVNVTYERFHQQFLNLFHTHASMKAISKREQKQKLKPWITKGMRKSVRVKNQLYIRLKTFLLQ